jgi:hypothetical protein
MRKYILLTACLLTAALLLVSCTNAFGSFEKKVHIQLRLTLTAVAEQWQIRI